jgi:hypothetical protein
VAQRRPTNCMQLSKHPVAVTRCFLRFCGPRQRMRTVWMSTGGWPRPHFDVVSLCIRSDPPYLPREGNAQSFKDSSRDGLRTRTQRQSGDWPKGKQIAGKQSWHKTFNKLFSFSLVAGTANSAGHSRCRGKRMRYVSAVGESLPTFVLILAAASQSGKWKRSDWTSMMQLMLFLPVTTTRGDHLPG